MNIAITGHRPSKLGNDYDLKSDLIQKIEINILVILAKYIQNNNITLITGMALGIDTLFAKIAIDNELPFIAAIPCKSHSWLWPKKSRDVYDAILSNPLCTVKMITEGPYSRECMQLRNKWMVDNCDLLIAVWNGTSGGTANCVKYAQNKGILIEYIDPTLI